MIIVAGIQDEGPTERVVGALEAIGANYRMFDQRRVGTADIALEIAGNDGGGSIAGTFRVDSETIPLGDVTAIYLRTMDDNLLPGISPLPMNAPVRHHCRRLHELFLGYADIASARVLNRPTDMGSNRSKPYQAHFIRAEGFDIPETLITNDPATALDFISRTWDTGGAVIYKSVSGIRSIVQTVEKPDLARLDRIRWCPTQFQRRVPGTDIRVHVIGQTALAASILSDATDYRYATKQVGVEPTFAALELDREIHTRCVQLAARLRLPLAGIDLRRTPDGSHVCFEVNPSPAFSFYEHNTGLPIATAIARFLAGEAD